MRLRLVFAVSLVFILRSSAPAQGSDLVLQHARVYPSPDAAPLENATIVVHGGKIISVLPVNAGPTAQTPPGTTVIDCAGMSVTAGLWNSHVHILPVKLLHADQKSDAELTAALQEMLSAWGFTTVFDITSILSNTENIRARIASGKVLGPRILTTGEPFFPPNGVPVYVKDYLEQNHIVLPDDPTTAAAVTRVDRQVHEGANGVKIFAGSIQGSQGNEVLLFPLDRAKAIVTEAHRLDRPVFAHPSNLAGLDVALDSGVDVLAHVTTEGGQLWSPAVVQRIIAAHMAVIPTLTLFDYEIKKSATPPDARKKFVDQGVARLHAFNTAGGEILFGTDVGYIYQFDTTEEYQLMQQAGMSFAQILASLTTNPAKRFGNAAQSGRIVPGTDADLAVFGGDPAEDIAAFSRVRYTIRAGKVIFQPPQISSATR